MRQIPTVEKTVTINARVQETGGPTGEAAVKRQVAADLRQQRDVYVEKANENAYLKGQTILTRELDRIEQEHRTDPKNLTTALEEYGTNFLDEVSDPNVRARFELQITKASQSAIARATAKRKAIVDEQTRFANLEAYQSIVSTIPDIAQGLTSTDDAIALSAGEQVQESFSRMQSILNATDADGMPLFSASMRAGKLDEIKDAALTSAAISWVDSQPDKNAAIKAIEDGEFQIQLPDGAGGLENINVRDSLGSKGLKVIKAEAKRQIKEQEDALLAQQELPLQQQIKNQTQLMALIDNPQVPLRDKVMTINKMDLEGSIRDDFAVEARRLLNSQKTVKDNITDTEKFETFNKLTDSMTELRIKLGGTAEELDVLKLNKDSINAVQEYQAEVMKELNDGRITEAEAKKFLGGVNEAMNVAIQNKETTGNSMTFFPGIQDPHGKGIDKINTYLKNQGREGSLRERKAIFLEFSRQLGEFDEKGNYSPTGDYKSTGNYAQDEKIINEALKRARQVVNSRNFVGMIDEDNPPNHVVRVKPTVPEIGAVVDGYEFLGGDPSNADSWRLVK